MKRITAVLLSLALCLQLAAQGMNFLSVNPDASASGLSYSTVARPADAAVFFNNTAAAALSPSRMSATAGYGIWQPKVGHDGIVTASGFYRTGKLAFAAGIADFMGSPYDVTSTEGRVTGTFTPNELCFGFGVAYAVSQSLSAGLNLKMASSSLAQGNSASAFAADIFAAYSKGGLGAGLGICNLGTKADYGEGSYALPAVVKLGASYSVFGFVPSLELDYAFSGAFMAALGAEYWIKDLIALRAGYHYGPQSNAIPSYASVGLGARFAMISLNASYILASPVLGGSMSFSVACTF